MAILANYHTHTARCMHATGTEEAYVQAALQEGYQILGFSDHTPWPFPSYESYCRMTCAQLPEYVDTVRGLQAKYADKLPMYLGLECEYAPAYMDWLADIKREYQMDYLIFGNHFRTSEETGVYFAKAEPNQELVEAYVEHTIKAMESGLFAYMAHPDLFLNAATEPMAPYMEKALHTICKAAVKYHMPLEYNLLGESRRLDASRADKGLCGYTYPGFWEIAAQYPIQAIVGCDAHSPDEMRRAARVRQVQAELSARGIQVLYTLPGLE